MANLANLALFEKQLKDNLPAHIKKLRKLSPREDLAYLIRQSLSLGKVSIDGGVFTLSADGEDLETESKTIYAVVADLRPTDSRAYYKKAYSPGQGEVQPDCFSRDSKTPDPSARDPQADTCAECEWNVFGSSVNGSGRACSPHRMLVIIPATYSGDLIENDKVPGFSLRVPTMSLRNLSDYAKLLAKNGVESLAEVVTEITIVGGGKNPMKLEFAPVCLISDEAAERVVEVREHEDVKSFVSVDSIKGAAPLPDEDEGEDEEEKPKPSRRTKPKAKPAQEEDEGEDEGEDEKPKPRRRTKPKAKPAQEEEEGEAEGEDEDEGEGEGEEGSSQGGLNDILAKWGKKK